ncbi:MAG: ATP-dependent 6-phosphofructokinase [Candidatus Omnitrophica bacterium]|nr:ATP-dependent 6-phosphofructokinase [Candidatus Omnitrophota bacterium]
MKSGVPKSEESGDLVIGSLGERAVANPLHKPPHMYVTDEQKVTVYSSSEDLLPYFQRNEMPPMFERAGPREEIFFNPSELTCGIVTCGGLCPGLNDVIRTIVLSLHWQYGVQKVLGFRYGYAGLSSRAQLEPMTLTPQTVDSIQHEAGTIIGSSRGDREVGDMISALRKHNIGALFVVGGDGTFSGAHELSQEIARRKLPIAVVGVPKTIDNDIFCSERTFGFSTAVEEARHAVAAAHTEAKAAWNGVGLVKLMGRDSGFIAANATLANSDVNYCLIPEAPFSMEGAGGMLEHLEQRLARKHHAVIVVAEGAGQHLFKESGPVGHDASGNMKYKDIGLFLKENLKRHFQNKNIPLILKYIDPSYTIRGCPANADDSAFCLMLGQNAVHAAMAGKTDMFISYWNHHFTHVPFQAAAGKRKKIDTCGTLWQTLLATTEQCDFIQCPVDHK